METNNKKEQVLQKIRKLLALADDASASQGEVENALKMAQSLMMKHQINEEEIEICIDDIGQEFIENDWVRGERKYFAWDVLNVLADRYGVQVLKTGNRYSFRYRIIGDHTSRIVVIETFRKLMPFIRNLAKTRYQEYKKITPEENIIRWTAFLPQYQSGYLIGLSEKLESEYIQEINEKDKSKWGLIIVKKDALIEEFIKENIDKVKEYTRKNSFDVNEISKTGYKDGKEKNTHEKLH